MPITITLALAVAFNAAIVPGVRIGNAKIGQPLPSWFGQPDHSDGAAGHVWQTWKGSSNNTLDVLGVIGNHADHDVELVRVTSPYFKTANGVKTGRTWSYIKSRYSAQLVQTYDSAQFSRKLAVMDNKSKGISFELTVNSSGQVTLSSRCKAIWVHAKNVTPNFQSWFVYEPTRP